MSRTPGPGHLVLLAEQIQPTFSGSRVARMDNLEEFQLYSDLIGSFGKDGNLLFLRKAGL